MMKKMLMVLVAILAILQNVGAYDFSAVSPSGHTLYYNKIRGGAQVTYMQYAIPAYLNLSGDIVIPETVTDGSREYVVVSIDKEAFDGCRKITSIIMPNTVTSIGDGAFRYCSKLRRANISTSVSYLGVGVFEWCKELDDIIIPPSVKSIGKSAFANCLSLKHIRIPETITYVGEYAFYNTGISDDNTESDQSGVAAIWSGSGFAIASGYVVTNYHVIDGATDIQVKVANEDLFSSFVAKPVAVDAVNDIAIIKIVDDSFSGFGSIPYRVSTRMAEQGEDVFVLGYPMTELLGNEIKMTPGSISSRTGFQGDVATYQISAPVTHGNSGGPLFDNKGNVVGIVSSGITNKEIAENVGYAIKISYLKNLIESAGIQVSLPTNNTISTLPRPEQLKRVKNFVFYIECSR